MTRSLARPASRRPTPLHRRVPSRASQTEPGPRRRRRAKRGSAAGAPAWGTVPAHVAGGPYRQRQQNWCRTPAAPYPRPRAQALLLTALLFHKAQWGARCARKSHLRRLAAEWQSGRSQGRRRRPARQRKCHGVRLWGLGRWKRARCSRLAGHASVVAGRGQWARRVCRPAARTKGCGGCVGVCPGGGGAGWTSREDVRGVATKPAPIRRAIASPAWIFREPSVRGHVV